MTYRAKPWLYANHNEEDRKVVRLLREAGVPYEDMGPVSGISIPVLEYGPYEFTGFKEIKDFIKRWKQGSCEELQKRDKVALGES